MANEQGYTLVAMLGPDGAGKTTLARAIAATLGARGDATAPRAVVQNGLGAEVFEFRTPRRAYQLVDFASEDAERALLSSARFACAVLVVSAADGLLPPHARSIAQAHESGARALVVALTRCDVVEDVELVDLVEMEVRDLLTKHHHGGDATPVVRCGAAATFQGDGAWADGGVGALVAALDRAVP